MTMFYYTSGHEDDVDFFRSTSPLTSGAIELSRDEFMAQAPAEVVEAVKRAEKTNNGNNGNGNGRALRQTA